MSAGRPRVVVLACLVGTALSVGGCAGSSVRAGASDYTADHALNAKAQLAADPMGAELADDPTYGGMKIVPRGIEVDVVGPESAAVTTAIAQARTTVPVQTRSVSHSWAALQALTGRLGTEQSSWRAKGVLLSMWGPDVSSNRVKIWHSTYDDAAAAALTATYGADWVAISRQPETGAAS
jgi:hypothetical protein